MPSAQELIRHIHDVNPTGQDLPRSESERRYGIKTRLQSLLVRQYKDALVVVLDPPEEDPEIVLLRHKFLGVAAGHAVVDHLDEEARSWVRSQLDRGLAETAVETTSPASRKARRGTRGRGHSASAIDAAMDEGHLALAAYDFEAARTAFAHAHALAPQAPRPIRALLDLLVYQLGLDAEALALADDLDEDVLVHAEVRAPLALAAARTDRHELAEQWVTGLEGERAAEVRRTLAAAALDSDDLSGARQHLDLARHAFASDPELLVLENRLGQAQALAARPHETALQEAIAREDWPAAEALARRILEVHPASASARHVLKEAGHRRRQAEQKKELDQLRALIETGDTKRARQLIEGGRGLRIEDAALAMLKDAIERSENLRRQQREQREVEEVVLALARAVSSRELEIALERYRVLAPHVRGEIRKRSDRRELRWLDEIATHDEEARLSKLIPALIAMDVAETSLAEGDLDAVRATLAPHRSLLRHFRRGRYLAGRLAAAEADLRRRQAEELLANATQAFLAGNDASSLVERIRRQDLPEAQAREVEILKRKVHAARALDHARKVLDECLAHNDHLGARHVLQILLDSGFGPEKNQAWQAELAEVEGRLRRTWTVLDQQPTGLHAGNAPEMARTSEVPFEAQIGLLRVDDSDDCSAIFASVQEGLLFIRVVDVATSEIRRLLVLRLPKIASAAAIGLADHCVWIVDDDARYVEISCDDWLPRHQGGFNAHVPAGQYLDAALAIPQEHVLCLATGDLTDNDRCWVHVVDTAANRLLRTITQECDFRRVPGVTPPLLARLNHEDRVRLVGARGNPVKDLFFPNEGMILGIATAPSGKGYVIVARSMIKPEPILVVTAIDARGIMKSATGLNASPNLSVKVASLLPKQLACICYQEPTTNEGRIAYLHQAGEHSNELGLSAIVPTHGTCELLQDEASTTCVAVRRTRDGVVLTRLDDAPAEFPDRGVARIEVPRVTWPLWCPLTANHEREEKLRKRFIFERAGISDRQVSAQWLADRVARLATTYTAGLCFYRFLHLEKLDEKADELLSALTENFPTNPYVRLAKIERDASMGRWTGDELLGQNGEAGVRHHLLHVHALICLHDHRYDEAIRILSDAPKGTLCQLEDILDLARALLAGRSADPHCQGAAPGSMRALVDTILWADHHVEQGDLEAARRLLDHAWIREIGEVQSLARLAHLYLAALPDPAARFRTIALMADFVDSNRISSYAFNLWLGKDTWDTERVNEVSARAKAWLDEIRGDGQAE